MKFEGYADESWILFFNGMTEWVGNDGVGGDDAVGAGKGGRRSGLGVVALDVKTGIQIKSQSDSRIPAFAGRTDCGGSNSN